MIALSCTNISKAYGIDDILEDISFTVSARDKVGLIGVNGAGKTTLMKILMGIESKDSGDIFIAKEMTIGYLEQNTNLDISASAFDYCEEVFSDIFALEQEMRLLELKMIDDHSQSVLDEYSFLQEKFETLDGYSISSRIRGVLSGLGFSDDEYNKPINQLSGGQKSRVGVARLLLKKPDILLLDEPTNHLDISAIKWLEEFLKTYPGTIIMISHDRYFLDQITTRIFEIEDGILATYNGNYSQFIDQKKMLFEAELKKYESQQKELNKQEALIRKFKDRGTEKLAKRARSREKRLAHMEVMTQPKLFKAHFKIDLKAGVSSGKEVLMAKSLSKAYEDKEVFQDVSMEVYKGDRIGLIGPNGVGKTTLFKILLGQLSFDDGELTLGHHVYPGYYDQEMNTLTLENTVLEEIHDDNPQLSITEVRSLLGAFLFSGDDIDKYVHQLSGGERGRLTLLKLMLSTSNLLFLDEPTNHLDLYSKETLEEALNSYDGTMITISHDRYFLNKICTKIFELSSEGIEVFWGNYDYYQQKIIEKNQLSTEETLEPTLTKTKQKELAKLEKEKSQEIKKQKQALKNVEKSIEDAESELHRLDLLLCSPEVYNDHNEAFRVQKEVESLKSHIDTLYSELYELLEIL
ncbi:ABC-F family ATP-binding cassette domain-containing protein [Fusibacter bizertensis]|uniref:ABC-F family ATP-binding cassette domain-containing protein n=1 Tax=Fusibacter bizertensis TaxID=1488331 RepID=A0ABT6NDW9_9FIRM|nr:ABC-F family ATP-binding cassette domain-containing protein [Fusibacter bizertensis]MDH8678623.1 ABC-F family ATP-binding cassette domain-containing protein [Fusibacter bizertensis]